MPNVQDHAVAVGSLLLTDRPFDALDALIVSQWVYMPLEGFFAGDEQRSLSEAWQHVCAHVPYGGLDMFQKKRYRLMEACVGLPRYAAWKLSGYVDIIDDEREMQFCACTYHLPNGVRCIAFRGTDLHIVGWKEDLNMSFTTVPSQVEAMRYVERTAAQSPGELLVCGHSKGGNLAVYAGIHAAEGVQQRISRLYSYDGPGLDEASMHSEGHIRMAGRIESYLPQSSVVGMLLHYHPVYTVVKAQSLGILQHDAMTWQVVDGDFVRMAGVDLTGKLTDETVHAWLAEMDTEHRRLLVDTLYTVVDAAQADLITDLAADWKESALRILEAVHDLSPETKRSVGKMLRSLFSTGADEVLRIVTAGFRNRDEAG